MGNKYISSPISRA